MKFFAILSLLSTITTSTAFVVVRTTAPTPTSLFAAQPSAITAALEASKKYGATSAEARVAWAEVEEVDSRDNSAALGGSLDTECDIDEPSQACLDYGEKLEALQSILQAPPQKQATLDVPAIPLVSSTTSSSTKQSSPALNAAVAAAQQAATTFGPKSREAVVAWSEVEDVAASGLANALGSGLSAEECSVTEDAAMEACQALEELQAAIAKQQ